MFYEVNTTLKNFPMTCEFSVGKQTSDDDQ